MPAAVTPVAVYHSFHTSLSFGLQCFGVFDLGPQLYFYCLLANVSMHYRLNQGGDHS